MELLIVLVVVTVAILNASRVTIKLIKLADSSNNEVYILGAGLIILACLFDIFTMVAMTGASITRDELYWMVVINAFCIALVQASEVPIWRSFQEDIKKVYVRYQFRGQDQFTAAWKLYLRQMEQANNKKAKLDEASKRLTEFISNELDSNLKIREEMLKLVKSCAGMAAALHAVESHLSKAVSSDQLTTRSARTVFDQTTNRVMLLIAEWHIATNGASPEVMSGLEPQLEEVGLRLEDVRSKILAMELEVRNLPPSMGELSHLSADKKRIERITQTLTAVNADLSTITTGVGAENAESKVLSISDHHAKALG